MNGVLLAGNQSFLFLFLSLSVFSFAVLGKGLKGLEGGIVGV